MGFLSEKWKREREAQGISLEEISQQTRIGMRLLQAIEEEAFEQLPGGIFNKSFVRQYARCLGLDEEKAVRDYLQASGAWQPTGVPQRTVAPRSRSSLPLAGLPLAGLPLAGLPLAGAARLIGAAMGVVLIAVAALYLVPRLTREPNSSDALKSAAAAPANRVSGQAEPFSAPELRATTEFSAVSAPTAPPAFQEARPAALSPQAAVATSLTPTASREPFPPTEPTVSEGGPEELLLLINAHSAAWLSITADGGKKWQGTLQPYQSREVQAVDSIRVTVGNAGGVELTLNGKSLGALGREGEVKTVTISARALPDSAP